MVAIAPPEGGWDTTVTATGPPPVPAQTLFAVLCGIGKPQCAAPGVPSCDGSRCKGAADVGHTECQQEHYGNVMAASTSDCARGLSVSRTAKTTREGVLPMVLSLSFGGERYEEGSSISLGGG